MLPVRFILFCHILHLGVSPKGLYLCCSDALALAPVQKVDKELCDPERLRTVEKLVDDLSVALSQHFPRMWSCLCLIF